MEPHASPSRYIIVEPSDLVGAIATRACSYIQVDIEIESLAQFLFKVMFADEALKVL